MSLCSLCYEKKILIKKCKFKDHMICNQCDKKYKIAYPNRSGCVFCNPLPKNRNNEIIGHTNRHRINYQFLDLLYTDNGLNTHEIELIEPILRREIFQRRQHNCCIRFGMFIKKSIFILIAHRIIYYTLFGFHNRMHYDYNFTVLPILAIIIVNF